MEASPPEPITLIEDLLVQWEVGPQTNFGDNTYGFSFINASPKNIVVRIYELKPPPPPPTCDAEVDWSYDEYNGLICQLELGHEGDHHATCREWTLDFRLTSDDLAS